MKRTTRELTGIALFIALTAIFSQISFPLPFTPVPFSCGLMAVYMSGILLKPNHALMAQIGYLLLGAIGLPVYSGFHGGISVLVGPTGGFLAMYPGMAALVSAAINRGAEEQGSANARSAGLYAKTALIMVLGLGLLYGGGVLWFSFVTKNSIGASLAMAIYPFVLPDLIKIGFCMAVFLPLRQRLYQMKLLPIGSAR